MKFTRVFWALLIVLIVLVGFSAILYWQGDISLQALVLWVLGAVVIGALFVFGRRGAQKDGYINGFRDGRGNVKKG